MRFCHIIHNGINTVLSITYQGRMQCSKKCTPEKNQRTAKKCELIRKNDKAVLHWFTQKEIEEVSTYAEHVRSHDLVFGMGKGWLKSYVEWTKRNNETNGPTPADKEWPLPGGHRHCIHNRVNHAKILRAPATLRLQLVHFLAYSHSHFVEFAVSSCKHDFSDSFYSNERILKLNAQPNYGQ